VCDAGNQSPRLTPHDGALLQQCAQQVQSGAPSAPLKDRMGNSVGSYTYGAGMINAGA
jgi:hypothetical protein